jgi:hypothetical protein
MAIPTPTMTTVNVQLSYKPKSEQHGTTLKQEPSVLKKRKSEAGVLAISALLDLRLANDWQSGEP